jgi:ATP-binding cassette subfamily F protein 3
VLELEGGRARFFMGPWHAWRKEKATRELALGRAVERQQAEIERLERFVTRFRAGTRARQAQARVKKLSKIDRLAPQVQDGAALQFAFKPPERSGRVVFELLDGRLTAGGKLLLDGAELWLERGEHISLVGPNGAGKTTLIEALTGRGELDSGKLRSGHNVKLGFLSQHGDELPAGRTVLEAAQAATKLTPNKARSLLGRFVFSGEDAEKPLDELSGGERRRLSLAILVASGANVLVLDEPTNHLDLESREALEQALRGFEGSILLVTHDRALLDAVGTRTVAFEDRSLRSYAGGWADYIHARERRQAEPRPEPKVKPAKPAKRRPPSGNGTAAKLEREIEAAEAALRAVEDELAYPAAWGTPEASTRSTERHEQAKRAVEDLYTRWESAAE